MCCGSCHLRNDASPRFFTEGASQDLSLHQIPGAEQLGQPRVHLHVPSTSSWEGSEPQGPAAGPRPPLGRRIKQRRCVAAQPVCPFLAKVLPGSFQQFVPLVGKGAFSLRRRMLAVQAARTGQGNGAQLQLPQPRVTRQSSSVTGRAEPQPRESSPAGREEERSRPVCEALCPLSIGRGMPVPVVPRH